MTAPTVDEILSHTHIGCHFHQWGAEGGVITVARAELRQALEAAYDPFMPDWPSMVEIDDA